MVTVSAVVYIQEIFIFTFFVDTGETGWQFLEGRLKGAKHLCVPSDTFLRISNGACFSQDRKIISKFNAETWQRPVSEKTWGIFVYTYISIYIHIHIYIHVYLQIEAIGWKYDSHLDRSMWCFSKGPGSSSHWEKTVKPPSQPRYYRQLHQAGTDNQNVQTMPNWVSDGWQDDHGMWLKRIIQNKKWGIRRRAWRAGCTYIQEKIWTVYYT